MKTRARLLAAARDIIDERGEEALRVEDVVAAAGVAKGTFFAHFRDKDALFERLIAEEIDLFLDALEQAPPFRDVDDVVTAVLPMFEYMAASRFRFDIILRFSGAAAARSIGPVTMNFGRRDAILTKLMTGAPFRTDISPKLLAEGIDAFGIQAIALAHCAINCVEMPLRERLRVYLQAWLQPGLA